jgi:hypothetical protein
MEACNYYNMISTNLTKNSINNYLKIYNLYFINLYWEKLKIKETKNEI